VVNISRLKRFNDGQERFPDREVEDVRPGPVMRDENEEQEWEVEKVLAQRGSARKREYLVKWSGYPVWESTWEKEKQLENAQGKLREFKKQADGLEAEWREQIMCIFKGVESVIGESGHHGDKEVVESEE
jgi:hypothetical protein